MSQQPSETSSASLWQLVDQQIRVSDDGQTVSSSFAFATHGEVFAVTVGGPRGMHVVEAYDAVRATLVFMRQKLGIDIHKPLEGELTMLAETECLSPSKLN